MFAAVRPPAAAGETVLAVHVRLDRTAVARPDVTNTGADGHNFHSEFVAGDSRVTVEGHLAQIPADVGAADADAVDADDGLARSRRGRLGDGDRAEPARLFELDGVHARLARTGRRCCREERG